MIGKKWIGTTVALALLAGTFSVNSAFAKDEDNGHSQVNNRHHEGVISLEKATKIARKSFRIKSAELEKEHGRLIWSFDIAPRRSKKVVEVNVDAKTGEIVATQFESANEEANEETGGEGHANMEKQEHRENGGLLERQGTGERREKGENSEYQENEHDGGQHHKGAETQDND